MNSLRASWILFWALVSGLVLPLWLFPFVPTHDGPAHLATARVLERCFRDAAPFTTYFEIRWQLVPNWSTHALLSGLLLIFSADIAHKVLLTGFVVGFAYAFRRLTLVVCPQALTLSLLGVLLCYCRCFWMGFYNYYLSVILLFAVMSVLMSHRHLTNLGAVLLGGFWVLAYLTHFLGYLVIVAASLTTIFFLYEPRWRSLAKAALALLPSGCLTWWYLGHSNIAESAGFGRWFQSTAAELFSGRALTLIEKQGLALGTQVFGPLAVEPWPVTWCLLAVLLVAFYITLALQLRYDAGPIQPALEGARRSKSFNAPMLTMLVLTTLAYFLGPEHLSGVQGGFIKQRFALLLPLFVVLLCREPGLPLHGVRGAWAMPASRWGLVGLFLAAYGCLLTNLCLYLADQNRELREFTAGRATLGPGRVVTFMRPPFWNTATSDPLAHAVHYYCLDGACLSLDNYQAGTPYFPIRFAAAFGNMRREDLVDAIVVWDLPHPFRHPIFRDFRLAFSEGRLKLFLRNTTTDPARK